MKGRKRFAALRDISREWWAKISCLFLIILFGGVLAGGRINVTASIPLGIYRSVREHPARGSVVLVCLPRVWAVFAIQRGILRKGECDTGTYGLGKVVLASYGDLIEVRAKGLIVNGRHIPCSAALERDSHGRRMPRYPEGGHVLKPGEIWLFSPYSSGSFDSRYFGPVSESSVRSVLQPIWTKSRTFC